MLFYVCSTIDWFVSLDNCLLFLFLVILPCFTVSWSAVSVAQGKQCSSREVQTDSNPGTVISLCSDVPNGDEVTSHLDVVDELKRKVRDLEEEKSCQESQMAEMQESVSLCVVCEDVR